MNVSSVNGQGGVPKVVMVTVYRPESLTFTDCVLLAPTIPGPDHK